ncbi:nitronate monooxygenase [Nocardia yamanashiensis]|uniref:nitronate monooxygenase n=1 Tax=Nocardia yamanashiensis TaxID=209247 RepID=UPI000830727B|nr:nitronate monooxygenase [Nocardia yamanashiensis]
MGLRTVFTELVGIRHPIVSAPMGGAAGGELAAAVSNGGGLGLVGASRADAAWVADELAIVAARAEKPWGVGFLSWGAEVSAVERALEFEPAALMLGFGDPRPFLPAVRASGAVLLLQVTDMAEVEDALAVGADVLVVQGSESGGHGARQGRSTLTFVPAVLDRAGAVPVLAAGGIADGRGLAAVLALGAAGAMLGTRFQATPEATVNAAVHAAVAAATGADTERSSVLDIIRGAQWPRRWTARTLHHPALDRWRDRETELAQDDSAKRDYSDAVRRGEYPPEPIWAGEAIDNIDTVVPARELVETLAAEAEAALRRASGADELS